MRNTLTDLNNHLFEQLERLNDDSLDEEGLERELKRAEGMTKVSSQIIQNAQLAFRAAEFAVSNGYAIGERAEDVMPAMLGDANGQKV